MELYKRKGTNHRKVVNFGFVQSAIINIYKILENDSRLVG